MRPRLSRPPVSSLLCLLASLLVLACGSSDEGEASTNADEESTGGGMDSTETDTGSSDPVCFPNGIYGPCSGENMGCQCLRGADIYEVCTANCTSDADCGDPADFPGATPQCLPVNPGDMNMVCSLACTSKAQCPCGLDCYVLTGICAAAQ